MKRLPPAPDASQLCRDLFAAAETQGLTNIDIAEKTGLTHRTIMRALGRGTIPNGDSLAAVAQALGVVMRATEPTKEC